MQFTAIDLSKLPAPNIIQPLNFDDVLAENIALYKIEFPEWDATVESDPIMSALRVTAYKEIGLRGQINDGAKACMIAKAEKEDLDNLVADFGLVRETITPATDDTPAVMESDDRLRKRRILAPEGLTNAGSVGAYMYWAMNNNIIEDALVETPVEGTVKITLMAFGDSGAASPSNIAYMAGVLSVDLRRPLTDNLLLESVAVINYTITAILRIYAGLDFAEIEAQALESLNAYIADMRKMGSDITLSGINAALKVEGVERVIISSPAVDIAISATQKAYCDPANINISSEVAV